MQEYSNTGSQNKDPELWELAKKRAGFKSHLATYLIINPFLWGIWWFTGAETGGNMNLPWPVWSTFGWGIGLVFHYLSVYVFHKENAVDKEYEKLLKERKQ